MLPADIERGWRLPDEREDTSVLFGRTRDARRPLRGAGREDFERRYEKRLPLYREVAYLEVMVNGRPPQAVADEIERWISGA